MPVAPADFVGGRHPVEPEIASREETPMVRVVIAMIVLSAAGPDDPLARGKPATKEQLKAITARGRSLAEYDRAAWHGTDAAQKVGLKEGGVEGYFARKTDRGWVVAFGRLKDGKGPFLIAVEAVQGKKPTEFEARALDPPREDSGFFQGAALAFRTAMKDFASSFRGQQRPYNFAVLPAEKGQWWVYFMPAQTKQGIYPLGADVRYLIARDGSKIVEKRALHKTVLENPPPDKDGNVMVMSIHTHILTDVPEDTDVFHVLRKEHPIPERIVTKEFVYLVEKDGTVKLTGRTEDDEEP